MASDQEIARIREQIQDPAGDSCVFSDSVISDLVDAIGAARAVPELWRRKAARVAHLVDITEGGSTRKMGSVHSQFLAVAKSFDDAADAAINPPAPTEGRTTTRRIVRG